MNKQPWVMLGWLLLLQLAVAFVGRSIGPMAPFIEDSFQLTKAQIGLLTAALFLGQSLVSIPSGWYADVLGSRKMLLMISVVLGGFFLLISGVADFWVLLLCVLLGGLGYGAMHTASSRGIINWFPQHMAGTAMGIKQMGVTAGSALSALVLLPLAISIGWRQAVASSAVLLLIIGAVSFLFYKDKAQAAAKEVESSGFGRKIRELIRHKPLVLVSLAAMGLTSAQLSVTTYLVLFVSDALLYPLIIAGIFLSISELSGSVGRIFWGVVSDRLFHGERTLVLIAIAIMTTVCGVSLALLPVQVSLWILVPVVIILGFCIAGFNGVWMNVAAESVRHGDAGIASGFSLSIGSLGVVAGPPVFGWIVDVTGGYPFAWGFISVQMLAVIGLLFWTRREIKLVKRKESHFTA